jgi:hypothetical protein
MKYEFKIIICLYYQEEINYSIKTIIKQTYGKQLAKYLFIFMKTNEKRYNFKNDMIQHRKILA